MNKNLYLNKAYGVTINDNEKLSKRGLCLNVLYETPTHVSGVRLLANGNKNFTIHVNDFQKMIETKELVEIECLPKYIVSALCNVFNANNLQQKTEAV